MSDKEYIHRRGNPDCDRVKYKLARFSDTNLLEIITLIMDEEEDDYQYTFVKNSKGETHTFYNYSLAVEKLNCWFPIEKIDPIFRLNDTIDSDDEDLIIDEVDAV